MAFAMCTWIVLGSVLHPIKDELPSFNNTDFCLARHGNSSSDFSIAEFQEEYSRQLDMMYRNHSVYNNLDVKGELATWIIQNREAACLSKISREISVVLLLGK